MLFKAVFLLLFSRTLTTPTEEAWPGVTSLPDYKPTFPNWKENTLAQSVKQLDTSGLDLLLVSAMDLSIIIEESSDCIQNRSWINCFIHIAENSGLRSNKTCDSTGSFGTSLFCRSRYFLTSCVHAVTVTSRGWCPFFATADNKPHLIIILHRVDIPPSAAGQSTCTLRQRRTNTSMQANADQFHVRLYSDWNWDLPTQNIIDSVNVCVYVCDMLVTGWLTGMHQKYCLTRHLMVLLYYQVT